MPRVEKLDRAWLVDVPEDKAFWCHDGRVVKNLAELAQAFREMSDDTFEYHLNSEKNDFSKWVGEVVGDMTLAGQLARVASRATATRRVNMRVETLGAIV